jgi:hypothetical protein
VIIANILNLWNAFGKPVYERVAAFPPGNAAPEERSMRLSPHCAQAQR